jgi:ATP-dependent exoDNAse (exonuclease V) alpha subunit
MESYEEQDFQISVRKPNSNKVIWINREKNVCNKLLKINQYIRVKPDIVEELSEQIENISINENQTEEEKTLNGIYNDIKKDNIFNDEQFEAIQKIVYGLNNKSVISLTGPAGSGKSYTILNMFKYFKDIFKEYKVCFCAPTNIIVQRCKEFGEYIHPYFKETNYLTISQLLGEKMIYGNDGTMKFIRCKKYIPLFDYDLVIIDESSMISDTKIKVIMKELRKVCIFIGDKNQLNPVNEPENQILYNPDINLTVNMRCSKKLLNKIFNLIIKEIDLYNQTEDYTKKMYNTFTLNLQEYIIKKKNDKSLQYFNYEEDFIDKFLEIYKTSDCIICNYTNRECDRLNRTIKDKIVEENNIELIDDKYYIGQQLIFNKRCEQKFNTSEVVKISKINKFEYELYQIGINDLYFIDEENISKNYNLDITQFIKKIQELPTICMKINNIFKLFNKIHDICAYRMEVYNKYKKNVIHVLQADEVKLYDKFTDNIRKSIATFAKQVNLDSFTEDVIINNLYQLLDKYRVSIFADVNDGYASTCHKIQGISIHTIFVNLRDILNMYDNDMKNKLKCIYTAFTRCSKSLIIFNL